MKGSQRGNSESALNQGTELDDDPSMRAAGQPFGHVIEEESPSCRRVDVMLVVAVERRVQRRGVDEDRVAHA
jgi:hypothetical protein